MTDDNALLEYLIQHCYDSMRNSKTVERQKYWFARMAIYVSKRNPETIEKMERQMGLA